MPAKSTAAQPTVPELNTEVANRLGDPFETSYMGVLRTNDPLLLERGGGGQDFGLYRDLARDGKVFSGSHLDAVGTRRVTVVYDAKDTQRVAMIARSKGVKPSSVYRDALDYYLAAHA